MGEGASTVVSPELATGTPALFRQIQKEKGVAYASLPWNRSASSIVLPRSTETGHYLLTVQPGVSEGMLREPGLGARITPVSINHDPRESVPGSLPAANLAPLLPGAKVTVKHIQDSGIETGNGLVEELDAGRELWRALLGAALIFLLVETIVAARSRSETAN